MGSFFSRLFGSGQTASVADSAPGAEPPGWASDLADQIQKGARAQARVALQLEDVERKLEAGFEDLRSTLARSSSSAPVPDRLEWALLFDALDLIGEARRAAAHQAPSLGDGLAGIVDRIDRFLAQGTYRRVWAEGAPVDPRQFRVVGTVVQPEIAPGAVARVVRAAVLSGDRLVREGEVLVAEAAPT